MQERVPSLQELEDLIDRALAISGQPYTRQEVLRDLQKAADMQRVTGIKSGPILQFESPEEAEWAAKEMTKKQYQAGMNASIPDPPNRKARRALQSKMKKRVKKIIKGQDKCNAKYRAAIKARSTGDDWAPGIGEVSSGEDFL